MNQQVTNMMHALPGLERHHFQDDVGYLAFERGLGLLCIRYGDCVTAGMDCFRIRRAGIDFATDSWIVAALVRALPSCWEHSVADGEDVFRYKGD